MRLAILVVAFAGRGGVVGAGYRNLMHLTKTRPSAHKLAILLPIVLIRCYQGMVRPLLGGSCKFHPTCSEYAVEALHEHGFGRGLWLAARRLVRCHPFGRGGLDPVEKRGSDTG